MFAIFCGFYLNCQSKTHSWLFPRAERFTHVAVQIDAGHDSPPGCREFCMRHSAPERRCASEHFAGPPARRHAWGGIDVDAGESGNGALDDPCGERSCCALDRERIVAALGELREIVKDHFRIGMEYVGAVLVNQQAGFIVAIVGISPYVVAPVDK